MARRDNGPLILNDLTGGRNGADPPLSLPDNQVVEARNVDYFDGTIARKRAGAAAIGMTFGTGGPFTGTISALARFVPAAAETAAELWAVDDAATPIMGRLAAGTSWTQVTPGDAIATRPMDVTFATLNGKLFVAYDSTVNRLHCWDGTNFRRVGLATPAAPAVADQGSGSYTATARNYKVAYIHKVGSDIIRRSELSAAVSFTPIGTGASARVTKPAALSEGETHWELYGAASSTYSLLATTLVATTTYDDSTAPASYSGNADPTSGTNTVPTSAKYIRADGNRLLMAGAWESGGKNNRVWFTPVLGSADIGDDERIPNTTSQKNWIDIGENDGGAITGISEPFQGVIYVFKYRAIWKLVPTGNVSLPYLAYCLTREVGCIRHHTIVTAEDEAGRPALYFVSHRGPYRIGANGIEYCGRDLEDIWPTVSLGATNVVAHGVYHADLHQVWFWVATGTNDPDFKIVFDVKKGRYTQDTGVRFGWTTQDSDSAVARCSVMFSNTLASSMSRDLKPHIGQAGAANKIWKCDTGTDDAGTDFQAYIKTKPYALAGLGRNQGIEETHLLAKVASGVTITQTIDRDFGLETRTSTAVLTASASETRKLVKFEGSAMSEAGVVQFQLGDSAAADNGWTLDALVVPFEGQEAR